MPHLPAPMKRRDFLTRVGVAGGAGAMYATMDAMGLIASPLNAPAAYAQATADFVPPSPMDFGLKGRSDKRVLVLGAGIAGLVTAYELGKAGYEVTILEARARPGGRNWTARRGTRTDEIGGPAQTASFGDGNYMNMGPARLAGHMVTLDYCRELGVAIEAFANQNADGFYYNEGADVGPLAGKPVRHRTAKADQYGYVSELLHKALDRGALDADLTVADKERVLAFLRNFGALNADREYAGTPRRGYEVEPAAGTQTGVVRDPPPSLSDVFQSGLGSYLTFEFGYDQAMMMFQPVGGMDRIAYALEAAVKAQMRRTGGRIVYSAPVRSMDNTPDGVRVVVGAGLRRFDADYCVCTIPPTVLRKVASNISPAAKDAIAYPVGVATGKIGLDYKRRWWEEDLKIFGGITNTNVGLGTVWYPSHGYLGRSGLVVGYYNFGADAERYGDLVPAARLREAVAAGKRIHGDAYETELRSSLSVAWHKTRWSEGGWVSWPSRTDGRYERALQPEGNIYFAGDHLSYYIAWQAGAIESARLAVTALHKRAVAG